MECVDAFSAGLMPEATCLRKGSLIIVILSREDDEGSLAISAETARRTKK